MTELIDELEKVYVEKRELEALVKELEAKEKDLRQIVMAEMVKNKVERVRSTSESIMVITTTTHDMKVADKDVVKEYLQVNGILENCMKLDESAVKRYAKARPDMPGMEKTERTSLTVRPAKEAEEFEVDESPADFSKRISN
jgi:hypothetical protein